MAFEPHHSPATNIQDVATALGEQLDRLDKSIDATAEHLERKKTERSLVALQLEEYQRALILVRGGAE